jgi:hypothetical protein
LFADRRSQMLLTCWFVRCPTLFGVRFTTTANNSRSKTVRSSVYQPAGSFPLWNLQKIIPYTAMCYERCKKFGTISVTLARLPLQKFEFSNTGIILVFFYIFLSLPLEHRASVKRFVSLQFLNLIDRTPWTGDQLVARPLPKHGTT